LYATNYGGIKVGTLTIWDVLSNITF